MSNKNQQKKHNPFSEKYHPNFIFIIRFLIVTLTLFGAALFSYLLIKGLK